MSTYSIYVTNNSWKVQTYYVFCALPEVSGASSTSNPYSNVFAAGRPVNNDGSVQQFTITDDSFAIHSNVSMSLDGDSNIEVAPITVLNGGPMFGTCTAGSPAGSFEITVGAYDAVQYPDVWCGFGKTSAGDSDADTTPGVSVAACWQADPKATFIVTPHVNFYIATGDFTKGQVVNVTEIGAKVEIDFTGRHDRYAVVTHGTDGNFTVQLQPNPPS
ncbi:uncharacterized protein N7483_002873 [Penicillium malachiteum]|uniref:uncharacterized protein n=1 Tax=Penicillium malachiteum TaxID=1324776 RepID=UPI00254737B5|nr:uncharacterized protein N7483_002873 [Penicillium malachiteum]KAJ5737748.1 hypothetical protein N7483_002873 [Penicillium malachiteum]